MKKSLFRILTVILLAFSPVVMTACNTVEGAGKDVKRGGEKLENAADRNK